MNKESLRTVDTLDLVVMLHQAKEVNDSELTRDIQMVMREREPKSPTHNEVEIKPIINTNSLIRYSYKVHHLSSLDTETMRNLDISEISQGDAWELLVMNLNKMGGLQQVNLKTKLEEVEKLPSLYKRVGVYSSVFLGYVTMRMAYKPENDTLYVERGSLFLDTSISVRDRYHED